MAKDNSTASSNGEANALADWVNEMASLLHEGVVRRMGNVFNAPDDWNILLNTVHADGRHLHFTIIYACLAAIGGGVAFAGIRQLVIYSGVRFGWMLRVSAALLLSIAAVVIASRIITSDSGTRQLIILWGGAAIVGLAGRRIFLNILTADWATPASQRRLRIFAEVISFGFIFGVLGLAVVSTLRGLGAKPGLTDLAASGLVSLPVTLITVFAYLRFRQPVVAAVAGPPPRSLRRLRFAAIWPYIATAASIGTFIALQISLTLGHPLPGLPLLVTLLLALLAPHIDASLAEWARDREAAATDSVARAAAYRTSRFAFILLALIAIGYQWAFPALAAIGLHSGEAEWRAISLSLVALAAAWAWNATGIGFERLSGRGASHAAPTDSAHAPRTRLETLFPLLGMTARTLIMLLALLTILLLLGMNVWPIITGLSVFGLAISFGSQTLVKDIVSGLFFLIDDAFRMGEYIETSGAKGTVERISVRSVSLRHPRGAVATVPYGQIGKIQNYSRDWVIEKLVFRVAFDTDVEKVRKLFKEIGAKLAADPDVADELLETFKSQGIASVEDGTLLVRGKFMARAGKQFSIRKKVFAAVQQAFRDNGIVAAPKPMMVSSAMALPAAAPAFAAPPPPAQAAATPPSEPEKPKPDS